MSSIGNSEPIKEIEGLNKCKKIMDETTNLLNTNPDFKEGCERAAKRIAESEDKRILDIMSKIPYSEIPGHSSTPPQSISPIVECPNGLVLNMQDIQYITEVKGQEGLNYQVYFKIGYGSSDKEHIITSKYEVSDEIKRLEKELLDPKHSVHKELIKETSKFKASILPLFEKERGKLLLKWEEYLMNLHQIKQVPNKTKANVSPIIECTKGYKVPPVDVLFENDKELLEHTKRMQETMKEKSKEVEPKSVVLVTPGKMSAPSNLNGVLD
jgi:hypothetical protein